MQPRQLNNPLIRLHYVLSLEGTNNLLFEFATMAPVLDKQRRISPELREALNWSDDLQTWFDYHNRIPGIYGRLYELCVVSLCSDIEYFFRAMFNEFGLGQGNGAGFFQRFDEVVRAIRDQGIDLTSVQDACDDLSEAFQIRHICIHNFGLVDDKFAANAKSPLTVGEKILIDEVTYRRFFDAYGTLLKSLDTELA